MDLKQLSEFTGKSESTIRRALKQLGIESKNGVKQFYTKEQVQNICNILFNNLPLPVKIAIEETFSNDIAIACANEKVSTSGDVATKKDLLDLVVLMSEVLDSKIKKLETATRQIGYTPAKHTPKPTIGKTDYCTIDDYVEYNKMRSKLPTYKYSELQDACVTVIGRKHLRGDNTQYYIRGLGYRRDILDAAIHEMD